jgi:predicted HTH transcriptional regulator
MDPKQLYDNPDLTYFCKAKVEGQTFERKLKREPKDLAKTLCGFANAQGGLLVLGISDDLKLAGLNQFGEDLISKMTNSVKLVDTFVHHRFIDITNEQGQPDRLLLMYVEPVNDRVVFRVDGTSSMRRSDHTDDLTLQEIIHLRESRSGSSAEDKPLLPYDESLLDTEVVRWLTEKATELEITQSPLELLRNLSLLIEKDGKPILTLGGYLLLAKNPRQHIPGAYVHFLKYEGTEQKFGAQQNLVKDETFWGPLPKIILRLQDFVPSQLREFTYLAPDGEFKKEPEYPADAWLEAIVNAIFHRSYADGYREEPIFIRIFDNRMEVQSPGTFPEGISPGHFRHKPRNPHLMNVMKLFRRVQMIGEGTKRMYQTMADLGLPSPDYSKSDTNSVLVILLNDIERRKAQRGLPPSEDVTQTANFFPLDMKVPHIDEAVPFEEQYSPPSAQEIKASFLRQLKEKGWLVDSFIQDTAIDLRMEKVYEPLRQSKLVSIYPGFVFRIVTVGSLFYLCLDPTIEVRNRATLDRVLSLAPYLRNRVLGKAFVQLTGNQWQPCRILKIADDGTVEVLVGIRDNEERKVSRTSAIIPQLKTAHIAELLARAGVRFDLFKETKRLSLNLAENAPRERIRETIQIAERLAKTVFPIRIRKYEINLRATPAHLTSPNFWVRSDLLEIEPTFYRDVRESKILDGLTKHGAFGRPAQDQELSICALCTRDAWPQLERLIDQIKKGSYRYQGFERTFGLRFGTPTILLTETIEEYFDKLNQSLPSFKPKTFVIGYFPERGYSHADYNSPYYRVKHLLLERGFSSQMVDEETMRDPQFKDLNLALDIFAKAGYVPWVLAEGLPDADLFLGLSYSSIPVDGELARLMAYVNVFDQFGRWRYYRANYQTIPFKDRNRLLGELLKSVVIDYQANQEVRHLHIHIPYKLSHKDRLSVASGVRAIAPDAEVSFVHINRHTLVRAYDIKPEGDGSLARGTYVVTRPNQFWIATTGANIFGEKVRGTPRILEINVNRLNARTPLDLRIYAQHILSLTKLNWASSKTFCHEPITIKYASDIAYLMNVFVSNFGSFRLHPDLERTPWFL